MIDKVEVVCDVASEGFLVNGVNTQVFLTARGTTSEMHSEQPHAGTVPPHEDPQGSGEDCFLPSPWFLRHWKKSLQLEEELAV